MPEDFINKYISIEPDVWKQLKAYSRRPENRRQPGAQAGIIIKEFLENKKECENA